MDGDEVAGGYRLLSHTADVALEAWGASKDECVAQAVYALVACFADPRERGPGDSVSVAVEQPADDEDLLVSVLDEVIYLVDVRGRIPVEVSIERTGAAEGRVDVRFATVPIGHADVIGAVPKSVSLHELRFGRKAGTWSCHVIVDV
jgi:SHS2 domain-containing protein